jgi:hypothetical protein
MEILLMRCPSQDWDDHASAQDEAAEAEAAWWRENRERVVTVACAILPSTIGLSSPVLSTREKAIRTLVDTAGDIVMEITKRGDPL